MSSGIGRRKQYDVARHIRRKISWRTTLWPILIAFDIVGFGVVVWLLPYSFISAPRLYAFLGVVILVTTCLAAFPIIRFLDTGWQIRYDEIRNKLPDGRLRAYLARFWRLRVAAAVGASPNAVSPSNELSLDEANTLFNAIYREQYGRGAFVTPLALLVPTIFLETVLVVAVERGVLNLGIMQSDGIRTAVAAIAGAYLFVVGDAVAQVRWRSLNIGDLYGYVLRMVLAVPIGISISSAAAPALGALVAFGVAGLPLVALTKLFQRLSYKNLNQASPEEASDELIKLEGVTSAIAAGLEAEDVNSIDQLLCVDPVLLTIRTGLPFDLILRLASQAITGRYLTGQSAALLPLGLSDAPAIAALVAQLDSGSCTEKDTARKILEDAVQCLRSKNQPSSPTADLVEFQFRRIAEDTYTKLFLLPNREGKSDF